jgi:hypothetical protein
MIGFTFLIAEYPPQYFEVFIEENNSNGYWIK